MRHEGATVRHPRVRVARQVYGTEIPQRPSRSKGLRIMRRFQGGKHHLNRITSRVAMPRPANSTVKSCRTRRCRGAAFYANGNRRRRFGSLNRTRRGSISNFRTRFFAALRGKRRQGHAGVLRGDANNHGQSIITVLGLVLAIAEFSQEGLGRDQRLDRDLERGGDRREVGQVGHAETPLPF